MATTRKAVARKPAVKKPVKPDLAARRLLEIRRKDEQIKRLQGSQRFLRETFEILQEQNQSNQRQRDALRDQADSRADRIRVLENERKRLQRELRRLKDAAKPKFTAAQRGLLEALPVRDTVYQAFCDVVTDPSMRDTTMALTERNMTALETLLAGVGMNQAAKQYVNAALDKAWEAEPGRSLPQKTGYASRYTSSQPVIVGSGVHAAVFAAVYHTLTGLKPLVLERKTRAGGVFAVTEKPSFYLNSRNRPGPLSVPGDEFGALNVLPGAPVQPAQLGGGEYLGNDMVAWTVRMTLMLHANVRTDCDVSQLTGTGSTTLTLQNKNVGGIDTARLVVAAGLTAPNRVFPVTNERYLSFEQFLTRMDQMFPLQGIRRVAVIGAGDSGKTAIEALTGQGPSPSCSVAALDFVEKIDWYGVPDDRNTRETWEKCNRSRYKGIGRLLPQNDRPYRVFPTGRASFLDVGYDCLKLDGIPYDYVIDCTGYLNNDSPVVSGWEEWRDGAKGDGQMLGRAYALQLPSKWFLAVGPCAQLPMDRSDETVTGGVKENTTSIFRYADRTARLAQIAAGK